MGFLRRAGDPFPEQPAQFTAPPDVTGWEINPATGMWENREANLAEAERVRRIEADAALRREQQEAGRTDGFTPPPGPDDLYFDMRCGWRSRRQMRAEATRVSYLEAQAQAAEDMRHQGDVTPGPPGIPNVANPPS